MIIQGDSVGSACINDGIFIVLCKNINLFKYGISFVDIINTGELVHITADGIRPGRIVFYHNIAGRNGFIICSTIFREINRKLEETSEKEQKSHLYMDMIVLIEEIADYIIPKDNEIRKGLGEIMGVLKRLFTGNVGLKRFLPSLNTNIDKVAPMKISNPSWKQTRIYLL